jgi:hypothetical protein
VKLLFYPWLERIIIEKNEKRMIPCLKKYCTLFGEIIEPQKTCER